jgi:hypothetical protein
MSEWTERKLAARASKAGLTLIPPHEHEHWVVIFGHVPWVAIDDLDELHIADSEEEPPPWAIGEEEPPPWAVADGEEDVDDEGDPDPAPLQGYHSSLPPTT